MAAAASTAGHALLLDCRSLQHMPIPIHRSLAITVIDTGLRRDLTGGGASRKIRGDVTDPQASAGTGGVLRFVHGAVIALDKPNAIHIHDL